MSQETAIVIDNICSKIRTIDEVAKILYNKEAVDNDIIDIVVVTFAIIDPDSVEVEVGKLLEGFDTKGASLSWEVVSELDLQDDPEEDYVGLSVAWVRPSEG